MKAPVDPVIHEREEICAMVEQMAGQWSGITHNLLKEVVARIQARTNPSVRIYYQSPTASCISGPDELFQRKE